MRIVRVNDEPHLEISEGSTLMFRGAHGKKFYLTINADLTGPSETHTWEVYSITLDPDKRNEKGGFILKRYREVHKDVHATYKTYNTLLDALITMESRLKDERENAA